MLFISTICAAVFIKDIPDFTSYLMSNKKIDNSKLMRK